ncbi:MAG: FAD-dependent oxidoreductase [Clostridia bacterium]|nr:FAD-dependent oxidoreductase [Clostridia bacterium]
MKKEFVFRIVLVVCIAILVYEFGLKPYIGESSSPKNLKEDTWAAGMLSRENGVYDIVVIGDEPDGIAAAVAAARTGAKTLLLSETNDMGGIVSHGLYTRLDSVFGQRGSSINKGFLAELHDALGEEFTVDKYIEAVNQFLTKEKNLEVVPNVKNISPVLQDNTVIGIRASANGMEKTFQGKRFIDSTKSGMVLAACNVPFTKGAEDLNMKDLVRPARLNFEVEGVGYKDVKKVADLHRDKFTKIIGEYKTYHINIEIRDFKVLDNGENRVIIQGVEISDAHMGDSKVLDRAYQDAVDEAKNFAAFLANRLEVFNKTRFVKAADRLILPEINHFHGEETLGVVDVMENRDFEDKIAVGAHYVETFADSKKRYIIGKPVQYGIPLGCLIPKKAENLMMTGGKASYSSLAATSADKISVNISTGQSAGIVAVYSLTRNMTPRQIAKEKDTNTMKEILKLLKKQGMYLPEFKVENKNASVWCYDSLKKLMSLGLVAGGLDNNFRFNKAAQQEDLAYILLNGVYRLSPQKYGYSFDSRIRPYINSQKLTKERVGEMLLAFHGESTGHGDFYSKACKKEYIDELAQLKMKDKDVLTMEDVYYLGAYNIRLYTGTNITY